MALSSIGMFVSPASQLHAYGSISVVPNFLVQTGDRTGTGAGGESFYGGSYFLCMTENYCYIRLSRAFRG